MPRQSSQSQLRAAAPRRRAGKAPKQIGKRKKTSPRSKSHEYLRASRKLARLAVELSNELAKRREAEEKLQDTTVFLDTIVENLPSMLCIKDAKDLRFIVFNRAGEELLGYDRSIFVGKNDYDFFPKEQADHFVARDREVLNSLNV